MPIHDWTRVDAGIFHAFHRLWIGTLCNRLNGGCLPPEYFALPEQILGGPEADVLALQSIARGKSKKKPGGGAGEIATPPQTSIVERAETQRYAKKADHIVVRHGAGKVIAVVEIVSSGNKGSRHALRAFVDKSTQLMEEGIHLLIIDLFPPSKRDPQGIHRAIWEEINATNFRLPAKKRLTLVAYSSGALKTAYVEPVAVGDRMPDMPLFLEPDSHVLAPLESTYQTTWDAFPEAMKELLE